MTKIENNGTLDYKPIYIGKPIEEELHRQERTVTWLSRNFPVHYGNNIYLTKILPDNIKDPNLRRVMPTY